MTLSKPHWPNVRIGLSGANAGVKMLSDPLASGWVTIPKSGVEFLPTREILPYASGGYIEYQRPQVSQSGFRRPVVIRDRDGALAIAGRAEFYWERRPGERTRLRSGMESLAAEGEAHAKPWHRYRIAHVYALLTSGATKEAVDLALHLTRYSVKGRPLPWGDPRGAVMAAWQRQSGGAYQWLYLLAAAKRLNHGYRTLRATAAWLPPMSGHRDFFEVSLGYLDGGLSTTAYLDRARSFDAEERKGSYRDRFLSEAATVVVVADVEWARTPATVAAVRRGLAAAHVNTHEWPLLARALRKVSLTGAPQVDFGGAVFDRWEVTADEYLACVEAGGCDDIRKTACDLNGRHTPSSSSLCWPVEPNAYPATWVTKQQAQTYCRWRSGRLPTTEEWAAAAHSALVSMPRVATCLMVRLVRSFLSTTNIGAGGALMLWWT